MPMFSQDISDKDRFHVDVSTAKTLETINYIM